MVPLLLILCGMRYSDSMFVIPIFITTVTSFDEVVRNAETNWNSVDKETEEVLVKVSYTSWNGMPN